jgi:hypothetical protein
VPLAVVRVTQVACPECVTFHVAALAPGPVSKTSVESGTGVVLPLATDACRPAGDTASVSTAGGAGAVVSLAQAKRRSRLSGEIVGILMVHPDSVRQLVEWRKLIDVRPGRR